MSDDGAATDSANTISSPVLDGRYRLAEKLGEVGTGEVYAASHVHAQTRFTITLLRPDVASDHEAVKRFYEEAKAASSIGHRNIVAVEDFGGLSDGRPYVCMERLDGAPLNGMIAQAVAIDRLLDIMIDTGLGLAAAHDKGIIHRDLKPENIFVTTGPNGEDIAKVLDFGAAKLFANEAPNKLARVGMVFGSPFYMAPEQALGNPVDPRTDIYALGVIMYEAFAGSLPFDGESFMGLLAKHITTAPEPVAERAAKAGRQLSPPLADIVMRCMRKDPAERFSSMDELVAQLAALRPENDAVGEASAHAAPEPIADVAPTAPIELAPEAFTAESFGLSQLDADYESFEASYPRTEATTIPHVRASVAPQVRAPIEPNVRAPVEVPAAPHVAQVAPAEAHSPSDQGDDLDDLGGSTMLFQQSAAKAVSPERAGRVLLLAIQPFLREIYGQEVRNWAELRSEQPLHLVEDIVAFEDAASWCAAVTSAAAALAIIDADDLPGEVLDLYRRVRANIVSVELPLIVIGTPSSIEPFAEISDDLLTCLRKPLRFGVLMNAARMLIRIDYDAADEGRQSARHISTAGLVE